MKNITVSIDDDLYRRARVRAAVEGTSVSAVVKGVLRDYAEESTAAEARARALRTLFDQVDARLGATGEPGEPGWRNLMYDDRFNQTELGRSLAARRR